MDANGTQLPSPARRGRLGAVPRRRDAAAARRALRRAAGRVRQRRRRGGFAWETASQSLTLRPCLVQFEAPANDTPPDPSVAARRGAAADRYGNIYWIADIAAEIRDHCRRRPAAPCTSGLPATG